MTYYAADNGHYRGKLQSIGVTLAPQSPHA